MPQLSVRRVLALSAPVAAIIALLAWLRKRRPRLAPALGALLRARSPQVTSFLTDHQPRSRWYEDEQAWGTFCPCCRRPLEVRWVPERAAAPQGAARPAGALAYASVLFGGTPRSARYSLGALALGQALQATGSTADRVLMHTRDVPAEVLEALRSSGLWQLKEIKYLHGCGMLGNMDWWHGVFTKLRLFGLCAYGKVVFLDLDIVPLGSLDCLFELEAPAAMLKATGYYWQPEHGAHLDGRDFFPTQLWNSPHGGINAGVMVLEPDSDVEARIECEVTDLWHPEHIWAAGPEQEYISRFYADRWRHIHSRFNFQLFRLDATEPLIKFFDGASKLGDAVLDEVVAVQFSSYPKPWDFADSALAGKVDQDLCRSLSSKWHGDGTEDEAAEAKAALLDEEAERPEKWPVEARVSRALIHRFLENLHAAEQKVEPQALEALQSLCRKEPDPNIAVSRHGGRHVKREA